MRPARRRAQPGTSRRCRLSACRRSSAGAFWGGLWGIVLAWLLPWRHGDGILARGNRTRCPDDEFAVALMVVAPLKGRPFAGGWNPLRLGVCASASMPLGASAPASCCASWAAADGGRLQPRPSPSAQAAMPGLRARLGTRGRRAPLLSCNLSAERPLMHPSMIAFLLAGLLLAAAPASSQQPETGPKSTQDGHPLRIPETGTRQPSSGSPETGYHGPRDVTNDAEPRARRNRPRNCAGPARHRRAAHPTNPARPIEGIRHGR